WPPAEWLLSRPLESASPREFQPVSGLRAIIVLGSGISSPEYERHYAVPDRETVERCAMAAWVYGKIGPLPVPACEGAQKKPFPSVMRELLRAGGVPDDLIWIEDRSRNTHENAVNAARMLQQRSIAQIVLVTDAQSMPRAAACFRKQGLGVTPAA